MPAKSIQKPDNKIIYSHIYNKGVEDRIIFNDEQDYEVFLGFLRDYLTAPADPESIKQAFTVNGRLFRGVPHQPKNYFNKVELIAYCLMPNHFHLLLHQITTGSIKNFSKSLCIRYSIYFNKKYQRTGTLFGGRYKFVQVEDAPSLRLLTRYFHQASDYSSYPEYLGQRTTAWMKTNVVLLLQKGKPGSYQNFVEKSQLNQNEQVLLERIVFESESEHFDRLAPPVASNSASDLEPRLKIPEFIAVAAVFVLLVVLGIRNIRASSPSPTVLPAATQSEPEVEAALVVIKTDDASTSINIRQHAATESAKIGKAKDGDAFEFISENSGWYEVKLPDNSTGFISAEYAHQ